MEASRAKPKKISLTKSGIEGLKPPATGRVYHYDAKTTGLALCITSTGHRSWYLYRKVNGKPERERLGGFPELTCEQARTEAAKLNGRIAGGANPADERRKRRTVPTLQVVFDEFILLPTRTRAKRAKSPKTVSDYRLLFDQHLSDLGRRRIGTITRQELERLHNAIGDTSGHYSANRVLQLVKTLFNYAIDAEYVLANPAARVRIFEEFQRARFLTKEEMPRFMEALDAEENGLMRDFFALSLWTAQRRSNVQAMRWDDLDLEAGIWKIPQTKTGAHEVPLTAEALAILWRRKKTSNSEWVLPGRRGHLKDPNRPWRALLARAGIKDMRLHDLRRTLASWQTMGGSNLVTVGKTLGHSQPATTAIYGRVDSSTVRASMQSATAAILQAAKPKAKRKGAK